MKYPHFPSIMNGKYRFVVEDTTSDQELWNEMDGHPCLLIQRMQEDTTPHCWDHWQGLHAAHR